MRYYLPILLLTVVFWGCRTDPYNQRWSQFLRTDSPEMSAWLDEEILIDVRRLSVPLGKVAPQGGGRSTAVLRHHVSLWVLNKIPGLGFERQPIILRGRAANGATIRIKNEAVTRRKLLYRFHQEHNLVIDLVVINGQIVVRCRSKEYIDIMGG